MNVRTNRMKKITAATFNIFHCEDFRREKIDFDAFAEYISSFEADIIGLNEVHGKGEHPDYDAQTEILAEKLGYYGYFGKATEIEGANPFGNAVLTRLPVKKCVTVPIPDPETPAYDGYYETRCVIAMELADPELTVLVTHFGLNPDEQENAVKTVLSVIPNGSCVFMGDLNARPDAPVLAPIKARLKDTAPDEKLYTFPSNAPYRKIDYIFVSEDIRVNGVKVPDRVLSDHCPFIAELELL